MHSDSPSEPTESKDSRKKALFELILVFLLGAAFFFLSSHYDFFENFHLWSLNHEKLDGDELLVCSAFIAILFAIYSMRRWMDQKSEVAARKEAQRLLRDSHDSLERRVAMRTKELNALNDELVATIKELKGSEKEKGRLEKQILQAQKLESIGILASGVAHDFNNLLSAIIGYADLALLKTAETGGNVREDVEKIRKAGLQASQLTKQLLAFSRKQIFDLKVININSIVEDMASITSRMIGETIVFDVSTDPNLWNVKADKTQFEQVLMNLVVNARDAMPNGGKLTIKTKNVELDEEYATVHKNVKPGKYILISVTDTGQGMTQEVQEKIFDPFFTTKEYGKGTGLGLATVFGIVKQHQGNIWLYSEPGHGTTFKIYLPATEKSSGSTEENLQKPSSGGTERILVVDDDETVRYFVRDTLQYHDYTVTTAASGNEALALLDTSAVPFDLVLTDVIMPRMDGWQLAEKIRRKNPDTRVLFVSGYDDHILSMEKINADPQLFFMSKPLSTTSLTHKIREIFDGRTSS